MVWVVQRSVPYSCSNSRREKWQHGWQGARRLKATSATPPREEKLGEVAPKPGGEGEKGKGGSSHIHKSYPRMRIVSEQG